MTDLVRDLFDEGDQSDEVLPAPIVKHKIKDDDVEYGDDAQTRPSCIACEDPNYSLSSDRCIACRILLNSTYEDRR